MTWIDDDKAELERQQQAGAELRERERKIADQAATIYDDLWNQLLDDMKEAENKGLPHLLTNGSPYKRTIFVPIKPQPHQRSTNPKEYVLALSKNQQAISITGPDEFSLRFILDLADDNVVRLKHEGEHKNIKEASRLILRPLLFPELFTQT